MTDIRRSILWMILAFSLILLWDRWQIHNGREALFFPSQTATASVTTDGVDASADAGSVPQASSALPGVQNQASVPVTASAAKSAQTVEISTDVLKLTFSTEGGSIIHSELLKYENDAHNGPVVMFDNNANRIYLAQTGLIGHDLPNHQTVMDLKDGPRVLADGQDNLQVQFSAVSPEGVEVVKTWTLKRGSYEIGVSHEIINHSGASIKPQLYMQLERDGGEVKGGVMFTNTYTGPAIYTDENKFEKVKFTDVDKGKASFQTQTQSGYIAMVQHYFTSAWIPTSGTPRENYVRKLNNNLYSVGSITVVPEIAPGQTHTVGANLYSGPEIETQLQEIAPGLELVKDYGLVKVLSKPLYWLLGQLHSILGNWGWSIVALVVVLKLAFYWLNAKAYASMAKMKAINPRIMQMRERLKDNPQQMQQEMMKIYREEKVNPLGGCLPILIQMPFFIALYWVLLSSVEMRHAPWILWITDLGQPDPYFILPLLMTISSLLQVALNPVPPDPLQAKMMWFMPLIFSVMFFFFPAGLVLYWLTNNILSIAQQWVINTRMGVPPQFNLPKFGKSK